MGGRGGREGGRERETNGKAETAEATKKPVQTDEGWIDTLKGFAHLSDEKRGISPWGFEDKTKEQKFAEYHQLTFMNNYRLTLSRVNGFSAFVLLFYTLQNMWKLTVVTTIASALRCFGCAIICVFFSRRHLSHTFKTCAGYVIYCYFFFAPAMIVVECTDPRVSLFKILITAVTVAGFVPILFPFWPHFCYFQGVVFWAPVAIILASRWDSADASVMLPRALFLAVGGTLGPLWAVVWSVRQRLLWVTGKERAQQKLMEDHEKRKAEAEANAETAAGDSPLRKRRSRSRSRSSSPMPPARAGQTLPRLAEEGRGWRTLYRPSE